MNTPYDEKIEEYRQRLDKLVRQNRTFDLIERPARGPATWGGGNER